MRIVDYNIEIFYVGGLVLKEVIYMNEMGNFKILNFVFWRKMIIIFLNIL